MEKKRILIIGIEDNELAAIKAGLGLGYLIVHYDMLPKVKLVAGILLVESMTISDKYLPVDKVIFHGIFEHDVDFITMLSLWDGPCLPNAIGMMDLRQRIPGLVRALKVSRFNKLSRGMMIGQETYTSQTRPLPNGASGIAVRTSTNSPANGKARNLRGRRLYQRRSGPDHDSR